jgi:hypothetical protein
MSTVKTQTQNLEEIYLKIEKIKSLPEEQSVLNKLNLMEMLVYLSTKYKENTVLLNSARNQEDITEQEWIEIEKIMPIIELHIKKVELKVEVYYLD